MDSLKYFSWGKYISSMNSSLNILLTFKHTYYLFGSNPFLLFPSLQFLSFSPYYHFSLPTCVLVYSHAPTSCAQLPPPHQLNAFSSVCMCVSVRSSTQEKHLRALNLWRKLTISSHQLPIDLPIRVRLQELLPCPLWDFCWGCLKSLHEESVRVEYCKWRFFCPTRSL